MTELVVDSELDDVLEHHGVKGMKWGQRKDPAARLAATAQKAELKKVRQTNRAAVERVRLATQNNRPTNAEIHAARANVAKTGAAVSRAKTNYKISKAQYKVDKQTIGKTQAKIVLAKHGKLPLQKARAAHNETLDTASHETTHEAAVRIIDNILFGPRT